MLKTGMLLTAKTVPHGVRITSNTKYQILDFDGDCILIMTDCGELEWVDKKCFGLN